jgi:hypothetical protein
MEGEPRDMVSGNRAVMPSFSIEVIMNWGQGLNRVDISQPQGSEFNLQYCKQIEQ